MIALEGSYLEGGGSIVRVALALSTLTQKSFEINNIRKNRPQPGLKSQHLFCVKALEKLCNAKAEGNELGSTYLKYIPGKIQGKTIDIDIETAGSIPLFLQSVMLPSLFADKPVKLKVIGGTDGKWAAPFDYFNSVFLPQLRKFAEIDCKLLKRGYYPKGNGKIEIKIRQKFNIHDYNFDGFINSLNQNVQKFNNVEQGHLMQIKGISHASADLQDAQVAERQAKSAQLILKENNCPVNVQIEYSNALSTGSGITLWAIFSKDNEEMDLINPTILGADCLGERGKRAEDVGSEAANGLVRRIKSKAPADSHLADQILKFMALLPGSKIKTSKITNHAKTNIYAIEKFLDVKFELNEKDNIISVRN